MTFELATSVILPTMNRIGEVLAISRRNDFTQWGFPGGKVDKGETNLDCAIREVVEETGIMLMPHYLEPIYSGPCYGADGRDFWVTTYLYRAGVHAAPKAEEGFQIKGILIEELCSVLVSPFAAYNRKVRDAWWTFQQ